MSWIHALCPWIHTFLNNSANFNTRVDPILYLALRFAPGLPPLDRHHGRHFSDCCSVTRTTPRQTLFRLLFRHSNDTTADTFPTVVPSLERHHGRHFSDCCSVTRTTPRQTLFRLLFRHSNDTTADTFPAVVPSLERHDGGHVADCVASPDGHHGGHVADRCCVTRTTRRRTRCGPCAASNGIGYARGRLTH